MHYLTEVFREGENIELTSMVGKHVLYKITTPVELVQSMGEGETYSPTVSSRATHYSRIIKENGVTFLDVIDNKKDKIITRDVIHILPAND